MVTKIENPTNRDIEFYTPNINNYLQNKIKYAPIKRVIKAGETFYSRSVSGNSEIEQFLSSQGCRLSQVRRAYIIIIAGQSNAVGYDESPWTQDDIKPLPYCYFEAQKTHGNYQNAGAIPLWNPGVDTYQDMQSYGVGTRTKGLHYELAKKMIGFIPEGYELEIWGWAYGMSGTCVGVAGSVDSKNLPSGSTKWNNDGALTLASGKRLNVHFKNIQPESKLIGFIWCQGEYDGMQNISADDYAAGFQAMADKMQSIFQGDSGSGAPAGAIETADKILYREFAINTKIAHSQTQSPENNAAFVEFTGGTFMAPKYGTFNYFKRNDFRTNLIPEQVEVHYGSTAPVVNADTGEVTYSTDREGYAIIDFYNVYVDGRVKYGLNKSGVVQSDLPIYCTLFNKLNNKYMGYVILNWSWSGSKASPAFNYVEQNAAAAFSYPLWIVYPGPQAYWNTQGTFKQLMQWQKENFTGYIDLPEDLATNNASPSGTKANSWNYWNGYGSTSAAKASHYGQGVFSYIADKVVEKIKQMLSIYGQPDA